MKKIIKIALVSIILIGLTYISQNGFRVNEKLRIPGLTRLLNPADGLWNNIDISYHGSEKQVELSGIDGDIRIYYDDRLVPHIFASSEKDAIYAQGYVLAQHRLWQMDFMTRLASGRLSEVLGKATIDRDLIMRKYGLEYSAKIAVDKWNDFPEGYETMIAFKDGINAYINSISDKDLPLEFKLANYKPVAWTNLGSALVSKYMAFTLSRYGPDIKNTNARLLLGEEDFNRLYNQRNSKQTPVIREDLSMASSVMREKPAGIDFLENPVSGYTYKEPIPGAGSNNWAIGPSKSASGNAILANDPHLQLSLPSVWYEMHIVTPTSNAYGVTVPGIPGIIIGFNEDIAYGSTNVGQDMLDYYTIDWVDKEAGTYRVDGKVLTAERIPQTIKVKKGPDINWDMMLTVFGPVILESDDENSPDLAMQWMAHRTPDKPEYYSFVQAMKCKDYDCYKKATSNFLSPAQNFVFADKQGNIGMRVNGNLPVKYKDEGILLKKGNSIKNMWTDIVPRESNPQTYNPSLGFVASANQISVDENYPHPFNGGFEDYRGRRINELLEQGEGMDVEDMKKFQLDEVSIKAREFLPKFLKVISENTSDVRTSEIYNILADWDYKYNADSKAPYIFEEIAVLFENKVWDEISGQEYKISFPDFWILNQLIEENQSDDFFDDKSTSEKENFSQIAVQTFTEVAEKISLNDDLSWATKKPGRVMHLLNIPGYSKMGLKTGGSGDVLKAIRGGFGPSWRMVVELGEKPIAWGIYPGGQSGNPMSPYYDNMVDDWAAGKYYELLFSNNEEEIKNRSKIVHKLTKSNE